MGAIAVVGLFALLFCAPEQAFCQYPASPAGNYGSTSYWWWGYHMTGPPYGSGAIRLVGGGSSYRGRVEILVNNQWGTVCDDNFDYLAARVVCRQLGHYEYNAAALHGGYYGRGYGPIWMDDYRCNGTEDRLIDCMYNYNRLGQHDCAHYEDAAVDCNYYYYDTTTNSYQPSSTMGPQIHPGATIQLVSSPLDVVAGVTSQLTLTCTPGQREDIDQILLIQINHMVNGSKVPVADVTSRSSALEHDAERRLRVQGYIPSYGHSGAYLQVTIDQPTETDCGEWECTLSGLDHSYLSIRETTTTTVHVTDLEDLAAEVGQLRRDVQAAVTDNDELKAALLNLQQTRGQGFTAFHIANTTAALGRLPFQREFLDTMGGFSNSVMLPPMDGVYQLSLTIAVNQGHHVTVALRHNAQNILLLTAEGGSDTYGQTSASIVTALVRNEPLQVEVVEFSPGAVVLASPSTFLSGHLL